MMIKAILLDLDDTLLGNPAQRFVQNYLALLENHLRETVGLAAGAKGLMTGTHAVVKSSDPTRTNEETFYAAFDPWLAASQISRADFDPAADHFYRAIYPQLQAVTQKRPGARRLVEWLLAQEYKVVVATNPFFPRTAIEQRLDWAGVSVQDIPFDLVTTLENMHYSKPHPAYYEEILARLGVQADEAIMVGDDWENDIEPAWRAGLNTFWIVPDGSNHDHEDLPIQPDGIGSLADFACRVQEENWLETLTPRPHEPTQIAPRLSGNLAALLSMVRETPPHVWQMRPDEAEWSPIEVLCHLGEAERDVQRPRLQLIAQADNPFLSQPKEPPRPASRICPEKAWHVALEFARERQQTIDFLTALESDAWVRPARHYIFGPTTLLEVANFLAQHDRLHMMQLCQTVGKCE
ncbi:MAG: HAD-IA family hydrolase [Anaerolineae bacterium]|nr:HAD-IA family hydrolase [Anaerolineae bacterium]